MCLWLYTNTKDLWLAICKWKESSSNAVLGEDRRRNRPWPIYWQYFFPFLFQICFIVLSWCRVRHLVIGPLLKILYITLWNWPPASTAPFQGKKKGDEARIEVVLFLFCYYNGFLIVLPLHLFGEKDFF